MSAEATPVKATPIEATGELEATGTPELDQNPFDTTAVLFTLAVAVNRVDFDYTPRWKGNNPTTYIDSITFDKVLTDKVYQYRVVKGTRNLGIMPPPKVQPDGSQTVNLLEYNGGYGIPATLRIQIFVRDPATGNEYKIAQWK
ncbi:Fve-domain-containing protein [Artomyces pyxidatus]|uniref:Fve-domain-containing protein n=1 Tax=Artomyces pyxidatus TaxID=48021 RepID=A0ACB8T300_9AGAM|nr:Fve-domain-containing protein [Artomyces pyxidatus]